MQNNPATSCDVLMFGDYFCDLIITNLAEIPRLGADIFGDKLDVMPGGAYIMATALHRLDVDVRWVAKLGNDIFSRFILEEAKKEGLDMSFFQVFDQPYRSISLSFSFAHDRGFISHSDTPPEGETQFSTMERANPAWVINGPFDGSPDSLEFYHYARKHDIKVFTDCQYTTKKFSDEGMTDLLCHTDIFAPNLSEACQLTGSGDAESAAAILAESCPLVVVKCGSEGSMARVGSDTWYVPALSVEVKDTTGAGDCFNAGFLAATLRGEPIETCLRWGNICGGLSVTRCGGASAAPTLKQLKGYLFD